MGKQIDAGSRPPGSAMDHRCDDAQLALRLGGRLAARRLDRGDEGSAEVRRVRAFDQVKLAPAGDGQAVHLDLAFAGAEVDLTGAHPRPGGMDATVHCAFGGGSIKVPHGWRVAWDSRGVGGVGIRRGEPAEHSGDPATADLRIHLRALVGGVGVIA